MPKHALDLILLRYPQRDLLKILIPVQDHCGYIHAEAIEYLSSRLQLPRADIRLTCLAVSIEDNFLRRDILLGSSFAPGSALSALLQHRTDNALQKIRMSHLRGRGGADFSAGDKWTLCAIPIA